MLEQGALEEAASLRAVCTGPDLPVMKALGVRQLIDHLEGACTLAEAVAGAKTETRRYAKRQMTWFRNRMADWPVHHTVDAKRLAEAVADVLEQTPDIPA